MSSKMTCLNHMITGQTEGSAFSSPEIVSSIPTVPTQLTRSVRHLVGLVDKISAYVDDVIAGKRDADAQIGIMIADVMGSLMVSNLLSNYNTPAFSWSVCVNRVNRFMTYVLIRS